MAESNYIVSNMFNPKPNWLFDGENYDAWRTLILSLISANGLYDLIIDTKKQMIYSALDPSMRFTGQYREYYQKQERAKFLIFERVTPKIIDFTKDCATVGEIIKRLDDRYKTISTAQYMKAIGELQNIQFYPNGSMKIFLNKYQDILLKIKNSGQVMDDRQNIDFLIAKLPAEYHSVVLEFRLIPYPHNTLEILMNMLIDFFDKLNESKVMNFRNYGSNSSNFNSFNRQGNYRNTNFNTNSFNSGSNRQSNFSNENFNNSNRNNSNSFNRNVRSNYYNNRNENCDRNGQRSSYPDNSGRYRNRSESPSKEQSSPEVRCYNCQGIGHFAYECANKNRSEKRNDNFSQTNSNFTRNKNNKKTSNNEVKLAVTLLPECARALGGCDSAAQTDTNLFHMVLDSGASVHIVNDISKLFNVKKLADSENLKCAMKNAIIRATHVGEMKIKVFDDLGNSMIMLLKDVKYSTDLEFNLLSGTKITESGKAEILFKKDEVIVFNPANKETFFVGNRIGKVYWVDCILQNDDVVNNSDMAFKVDDDEWDEYDIECEIVGGSQTQENDCDSQDDSDVEYHTSQEPSTSSDLIIQEITKNRTKRGNNVKCNKKNKGKDDGNGSISDLPNFSKIQDGKQFCDKETQTDNFESNVNSCKNENIKLLWHKRMGHLSARNLNLLKDVVVGIPKTLRFKPDDFLDCEICHLAKSTRLGHSGVRTKPSRKLEIVSSDVMGPYSRSIDNFEYIVTFIDHFSKFTVAIPISKKSDVPGELISLIKKFLNRFPESKIVTFRCDGAKEYSTKEFKAFLNENGITLDVINPYSPELNGTAERQNRTIMERCRALIYESNLEQKFWSYAIQTAAFLLNRTPTRVNKNFLTPFEVFFNKKPDISNLKLFGTLAFRHVPLEVRQQAATKQKRLKMNKKDLKLVERSEKNILIGFTNDGYCLIDPYTNKIINSSDVKFNENFKINNFEEILEEKKLLINKFNDYAKESSDANVHVLNIVAEPSKPFLEDHVPSDFSSIFKNPFKDDWLRAVDDELDSMRKLKVWSVVPKSNQKVIDTRWVFVPKNDNDGNSIPKARLVARGFRDRTEYSISETYAPVVQQWLVRWLLSHANKNNFHLIQYDVKTAFLNSEIKQQTFLSIPQGLNVDRKKFVLQLEKSIYGLKTSSKNWYDLLDSSLVDAGYVRSKIDRCLYSKDTSEGMVILIVYVDDILAASNSPNLLDDLTQSLKFHFEIKVNNQPKFFIGLEFEKQSNVMLIHQNRYIDKILKKFGFENSRPTFTPMESGLKITKNTTLGVDDRNYRAMIGALLYLARGSRPDIGYPVNYLSRFQNCSTQLEVSYVKRIFRYIKYTKNYKLKYSSNSDKSEAYIDASYAPDVDDVINLTDLDKGKSVSGYMLKLNNDLINWNVRKQRIFAASSTSAEIIAIHDFLDEIRLVRFLRIEYGDNNPITVYEDNISADTIVNGGENKRLRALIIKCYDIIDAIMDLEIVTKRTKSATQLADIMTKATDRDTLLSHCRSFFQMDDF